MKNDEFLPVKSPSDQRPNFDRQRTFEKKNYFWFSYHFTLVFKGGMRWSCAVCVRVCVYITSTPEANKRAQMSSLSLQIKGHALPYSRPMWNEWCTFPVASSHMITLSGSFFWAKAPVLWVYHETRNLLRGENLNREGASVFFFFFFFFGCLIKYSEIYI